MIGDLVPRLPYLTRLDKLLLGSTVLVAVALVASVAGAFLVSRDRVSTVARMDVVARVALPAGYLLLLVWVGLLG